MPLLLLDRSVAGLAAHFAGGAAGTALSTFAWSRWAWPGAVAAGAALPVLALVAWAIGTDQAGVRGGTSARRGK